MIRKFENIFSLTYSKILGFNFLIICSIFIFNQSILAKNEVTLPILNTNFVIFIPILPTRVNPTVVNTVEDVFLVNQIYDKLFTYKNKNDIQPVIAEKLVWCPNQTCLRIFIRQNKYFSDNSLIKADDVIRSFKNIIKQQGAKMSWAFGNVKGFDEFIQGLNSEIVGMHIEKNHIVVFDFNQPNPLFVQILSGPFFYIFKQTVNREFIGSGNFKITSSGEHFVKMKSRVKEINVPDEIVITDQNMTSANIIFANGSTSNKSLDLFNKINYDTFNTKLLVSNMNSKLPGITEHRCDLISLLSKSFKLSFSDTGYFVYKGIPFTNEFKNLFSDSNIELSDYKFKNFKIEILLAESISGFLEVNVGEFIEKLANMGIDAKITKLPKNEVLKRVNNSNFEFAVLDYSPDYPHPDAILTPFLSSNQQFNWSGIKDTEIDRLLSEARSSSKTMVQNQLYRKVILRIGKLCPVAYLGYTPGRFFLNKGYQAPQFPSMGWHYWHIRNLVKQEISK